MKPEDISKELESCVRCGRCLSVCPLYDQSKWEGSVARGKLALLRAELDGQKNLAGRMKDLLSYCLLCGACAENCASGVRADEAIQAGRTLAVGRGGLNRFRSMLLRDVLSGGAAVKTVLNHRTLFLKNVPKESGLQFRFPLPGVDRNRWLPIPAEKPFLKRPPQPKAKRGGPRIALFVGCVSNYLRPESAEAAVRLLEHLGAEVVIPSAQVCCGKPAAGAGDAKTAAYLARRNIDAFRGEKFDFIAAFCGTCSEHLKHYAEYEGGGLSERTRDFSELLCNDLNWQLEREETSGRPRRVFYHDPCHVRRKQKIFREPRKLIESLPGVELVGGDEPPVCCGYGGIFNLWHYDLSQNLFQKRAEIIDPYEPDLVTTSCSGCLLQFEDQLRATGRTYRVQPLVELLAECALPDRAEQS